MLEHMWGNLSFLLALIVANVLVGYRMPHRKYFYLRAAVSITVFITFKFTVDTLFLTDALIDIKDVVRTLTSFMLYLLTITGMKVCYNCNIWAAVFCGTAGYCLQHLSQRLYMLIYISSSIAILYWIRQIILVAVTAMCYIVFYYIAIKKSKYTSIMIDNKIQIVVAVAIVLIAIFINPLSLNSAMRNQIKDLQIFTVIFSIVITILGLFVEFGMIRSKNMEMERDTIRRLRKDEHEQYMFEKAVIDIINVKCHDLKHQISGLSGKASETELKEIEDAIDIYDSRFKTGNEALDVILTRKSLFLKNKNILLTCMADGHGLSFMSDEDIYSLFGNILDNALEAAEKVEDPEKRIISITVTVKDSLIFISAVNYFSGKLTFFEGLPQTTKEDRAYHGFGMRSINMIAKKYNGDCTVRASGDMFSLDIMFFIPDNKNS